MKKKQILAFILSASMFLSTSVGSISFAKEDIESSSDVTETISQDMDEVSDLEEHGRKESPGDPEEIEKAESQENSDSERIETEEKKSEDTEDKTDTEDTNADETVSSQSDDVATQAVTGTVIYLNAESGSDTSNGSDASHAVQSLKKALELAGENGTILIGGNSSVVVTEELTLDENVTIKKTADFNTNKQGISMLTFQDCRVTMNQATIDGGKAEIPSPTYDTALILVKDALFEINDGAKIGNAWGGGIDITGWNKTSDVIMNGGEIYNLGGKDNGSVSQHAVWLTSMSDATTATFTMTGGSIHDNQMSGAAIYQSVAYSTGESVVNMSGGSIKNNTAKTTGAECVGVSIGKGVFNLSGGEISGHTGSGVHLNSDNVGRAVLNMSGGTISGNTSERGGAIWDTDNGEVNITGGTLSGNTATKSGGAIRVEDTATLNITGGTIENNTADTWGGAIDALGTSTVDITGGKITGNTSPWGGAMFCWQTKNITIGGDAEITNNESTRVGGGGININSGAVKITGGTISQNTAPNGGGIEVDGGSLTLGGTTVVSENTATNDGGGGVYVSNGTADITGGTISGNTAAFGGGVIATGGTTTISGTTEISSNEAIDTNGCGLLVLGGTVDITGGEITANEAPYGGGIHVEEGAATIGGTTKITKNKANVEGGGGIGTNGGTLEITGGEISENTANYGAGIASWFEGAVTIKGDTLITKNKATGDGGGGISVKNQTLTLSGGTISENEAPFGAALGIWGDANVVMSGDTSITGNKVLDENTYGGTVYVGGRETDGSTFTMTGGSIINNVSEGEACPGIVAYGADTGGNIIISGGTISGNTTAQGVRQGIKFYKGDAKNGTVKLSGSPDITDEICLNGDQDDAAIVEITGEFTPKNPIPINDTSWIDYRTIVTYANGLTAKLSDFTKASKTERQIIIQDENDAQNLQSLNKRSVTFQEKDDATQKYGEIYVMPKEKITTDQIPDVKKEDNELLGWRDVKTDKDWDFATDTVTEDTVLYPVWKSTAKMYTVRYVTNTTNSTTDIAKVKEGGTAIKPQITWKGRTLDGWYTTSDFQKGTKWNFDDPVMKDMTLYAKWLLDAPTGTLEADNAKNGTVTIHTGESVVLTATANHEAVNGINFKFTWFKDGKEIENKSAGRAVSEQNTLEVSEAGTYSVKIVADDGTRTSETVETNTMKVVVTDHDFGEWVITKQPTETEKGLKERTCKICGLKETAEIPATGKKEDPVDPEPTPDDPKPTPDDPTPNPGDKKDDVKPETDKKNESVKTETTTTTIIENVSNGVKTGDTNSLGLAVGAMVLAAGIGAGTISRRTKKKNEK